MAKHFEYALQLPAAPEAVFRVLIDTEVWRNSKLYRTVRWVKGEPWQVDSVRELETKVPFRSRHRQRVLECISNERIGVLSHGFGYTMQTQIVLARGNDAGGTEVRYLIDVYGVMPLLFGFAIEDFVDRFMSAHMSELTRLCQEASTKSQAPSTR
jgi:hypothetical protein